MTKSGFEKRKRNVLRRCLYIASDGADVTCDGRLFQKLAPKTGKARLPTVERLNSGTTSWLEEADWSLYAMMARQRHGWSMTTDIRWCTAIHSSVSQYGDLKEGVLQVHDGGWRVGLICLGSRILKMRFTDRKADKQFQVRGLVPALVQCI